MINSYPHTFKVKIGDDRYEVKVDKVAEVTGEYLFEITDKNNETKQMRYEDDTFKDGHRGHRGRRVDGGSLTTVENEVIHRFWEHLDF